ncbi:MAG: DNA translocase FtsK 4TM domain-containing protein, partial [bacterium]
MKKKYKEKKIEKTPVIHHETKKAVIAVLFFACSILILISAFGFGGKIGNNFFNFSEKIFGWGVYLLAIFLIFISALLAKSITPSVCSITIFFIGLMFLSVLATIQILFGKKTGGAVGGFLGANLESMFDFTGSLIVSFAAFLASLLIALNLSLSALWGKITLKKDADENLADPKKLLEKNQKNSESTWESIKKIIPASGFQKKEIGSEPITAPNAKQEIAKNDLFDKKIPAKELKDADYDGFPLELLANGSGSSSLVENGQLEETSQIIKKTLENFGINVEMGDINVGPTVTQYALKPAEGIKLSRIVALQNDLALALAAHPIRIEAPIPGKSLVGIEVPNKIAKTVRLKEILQSHPFKHRKTALCFGLGLDVSGESIVADLAKMPHMLIAGSTGSGKSVCINTIITSFLSSKSPQKLKFIMVDPKRVELTSYNGIPHLLCPVITTPGKTVSALKWAIKEMDDRLNKLQKVGARDIESFNCKSAETMPYIVFVIDELADLMAVNTNEIEAGIVRLAQMARAVGIHLIVSTQRPSVEVITGLIKANIPARIAFRVASQIDSRTILDSSGAEKLLGNGDMLFLPGNLSKPKRIQNAYLSEEEVSKVVNHLKEKCSSSENSESENSDTDEILSSENDINSAAGENSPIFSSAEDPSLDDDLFNDAKEIVLQAGKASASLLQRKLRIGYARAARLIDILEEKRIVGPADGARPRNVLYSNSEENSESQI